MKLELEAGMEASKPGSRRTTSERAAARTLVWIDAREARIVRWDGQEPSLERIESEVPDHRKATGLVRRHPRHEAGLTSGGYGHPRTSDDTHRLEHLSRFLDQVAAALPPEGPVHLIGPGTVRDHLEALVREGDTRHRRDRLVTNEPAPRLSDRQLMARIRALAGLPVRRRTVGAYRWAGEAVGRPSGTPAGRPRRVVRKPAAERGALGAREAKEAIEQASADVADSTEAGSTGEAGATRQAAG